MANERCRHRWRIPSPPDEPIGVCKVCGARKRFSNEEADLDWKTRARVAGKHRPYYRTPINNVGRAFGRGR